MRPRVIDGVTVYVGCTFRSKDGKVLFECTGQDTEEGSTILLIGGTWWSESKIGEKWELVGDVPLVPFPNHDSAALPVSELTEEEKQLADEIIAKDAAVEEPELRIGDEVETMQLGELSGMRGIVSTDRDQFGWLSILVEPSDCHIGMAIHLPASNLKLIKKSEDDDEIEECGEDDGKELKIGDEVETTLDSFVVGLHGRVCELPNEHGMMAIRCNGRWKMELPRSHVRPVRKQSAPPHPIQPIVQDKHGCWRFKPNAIVQKLLDEMTSKGYGLNEIAADGFGEEDREQLAQLIGYSVVRFSELSYVTQATRKRVLEVVECTVKKEGEAK